MLVILVTGARLVLGALLFVAGVAKLLDQHGTVHNMTEFGVPRRLAPMLALGIPAAELTATLLLVVSPIGVWWGALLAEFLLVCFTIGISANLLRGRRPACSCFGRLSSTPISISTVLRNIILLFLGAFVLWQLPSQDPMPLLLSNLRLIDTALILVCGVQGWLILQLLRQNGRLLVRIEKLEAGSGSSGLLATSLQSAIDTPAPAFSLPDLSRKRHSLASLGANGQPVLLFFTDPACAICVSLLPDIAHWQQVYADTFTIALITRGSAKEIRDKMATHQLDHVLIATSDQILRAYGVQASPAAVLIHPDGTFASEIAGGPGRIRQLVRQALTMHRSSNGVLARGDYAPTRYLVTVDQTMIDLHHTISLILFWDTTCAYCQDVRDALRLQNVLDRLLTMQVIIITTEPDVIDLPYLVVHDNDRTISGLFGVQGAPAAVVINPDGRAAEGVVGAQAVRSLLLDIAEPVTGAL